VSLRGSEEGVDGAGRREEGSKEHDVDSICEGSEEVVLPVERVTLPVLEE